MENIQNTENELLQFVINEKIESFAKYFAPCKKEMEADEIFSEMKLREYFQAYPKNIGDPFMEYINALKQKGFPMNITLMGEPAIFVKTKFKAD